MSRHANRRQLALFASGEDLPLFTDAPVPVIEPEPRQTVTPEAPPVSTWAWTGTLEDATPTEAEPTEGPRCLGTKQVGPSTYRCVLPAYHGGGCHFTTPTEAEPTTPEPSENASFTTQAADLGRRVAAIHHRQRVYGSTESTEFYYDALRKLRVFFPNARAAFDSAYRAEAIEYGDIT